MKTKWIPDRWMARRRGFWIEVRQERRDPRYCWAIYTAERARLVEAGSATTFDGAVLAVEGAADELAKAERAALKVVRKRDDAEFELALAAEGFLR